MRVIEINGNFKKVIINGNIESVPAWANWFSFDPDGEGWIYEGKPEVNLECGFWSNPDDLSCEVLYCLTNKFDKWKDSLIELVEIK